MSTSRPRHLRSPGPRHLAMSRWPWRLGLVAFGLTTVVLAALVTSATLSPQPPPPRRAPTLVLPAVQAEPATRSASTPTTGPRESTTAPTLSTPHPRHRAAGRQRADHHSWTGHGPSASHRWHDDDHRGTSTVGPPTTQPPVTTPTRTTAP